jgi:hypothetical protein
MGRLLQQLRRHDVSTIREAQAASGMGEHRIPSKRKPSKRMSLDEPFASLHPNQMLLFDEWCALNSISPRTGRRIIASGNGPVVTQLAKQRIGITVENNARWQASRARK